jgi:hypothetical protein
MPVINFAALDDSYEPVPPGQYVAEVTGVEQTQTRSGVEMWRLELTILDGTHEGRRIFDNLVFSERGVRRVKLVADRLGIDVSGEMSLEREDLRDRTCLLDVQIEDYESRDGILRQRNAVPYAGYSRAPETTKRGASDGPLPF